MWDGRRAWDQGFFEFKVVGYTSLQGHSVRFDGKNFIILFKMTNESIFIVFSSLIVQRFSRRAL